MAQLFNPETQREVTLFAPTRLGRSRDNHIVVTDQHASKHHAVIFRRDGRWHLEPLGKTNGTWLDGELLKVHETRALERGARIRLGRPGNDPELDWILVDDAAPVPSLVSGGGVVIRLDAAVTELATREPAPARVKREVDRAGERLVLERAGEQRLLAHGDAVEIAGTTYHVVLVEELKGTLGAPKAELLLRLFVSPDGEDIDVELEFAGMVKRLPLSGDHAEVVLRLAEKRIQDRREGVPGEREGYTDELAAWLNKPGMLLNTYCYRINKLVKKLGVVPSGMLIRYNAASQKRRLDVEQIEIIQS